MTTRLGAGNADLAAIGLGLVGADVDEPVGDALEQPLDGEIDAALERPLVVVQAAAMRAVDAGDRPPAAEPGADQPAVDAALGAVAVHHVGLERAEVAHQLAHGAQIGGRDLPAHGKSRRAEREPRRDRGDQLVLEGAAVERIADDADRVAGLRLGAGEIDDVAEDAADRRADDVDDAETRHCHTLEPDGCPARGDAVGTDDKINSTKHGRR